MTYKLTSTGIVNLSDGSRIPIDPQNSDYQDYLVWVAAGNTPLPEFTQEELDAKAAEKAAKAAKKAEEDALRVEYGLNVMSTLNAANYKAAVKDKLSKTELALLVEQMAIALYLLDQRCRERGI